MITSNEDLHQLAYKIIKDLSTGLVPDKNIFFANQGISYPEQESFIVIMLDIQKSPFSVIRSKTNIKRITINLNIFTKDLIFANKFMDPGCYINQNNYPDLLNVHNGAGIINRTYLEKGNFLSRYDTSFGIDVSIEQDTSVDVIAKQIGEYVIENKQNHTS